MDFKRIFKRGKKKMQDSESHGSPSRAYTPTPGASIRGTSPTSVPSTSMSARVLQPFLRSAASPPLEHRQMEPATAGVDTWANLTAFSGLLHRTPSFTPLAAVIDDLSWFIRSYENFVTVQEEYQALRTQLEILFNDLHLHFSTGAPPSMTTGMLNLCGAIGTELRQIYGTQDRNSISRLLKAEHDLDKITECYRRIQSHLDRVMLNATLNMLRVVDKQAAEAQLRQLNPSMSARYNSAEAHVVQRRECTANTREQVLLDLNAWKDKSGGENVCWMSGMAGTGKTTITYTLCSSLDQSYELGASFFCTRSLPACRDVKLILPTIAYQLARFSDPFRGALLQVLDRDPDVHTKVLRVQFQRMILEPLRDVKGSLPTNLVVVIDALDECDDGNGVEQILVVLLENASELPVKFLVSSRPEYHIRQQIGKSDRRTQITLHELDEKIVKADIETHLRVELALMSIPLTTDQLDDLVKRAGVLFIYAATVLRYITDGDTLERLDIVLQTSSPREEASNKTKEIDGLYEAVLASALSNPRLEHSEKQRMELVLHTVVCAQEPLTVAALAGLLGLSSTKVVAALKPLWSVLHISGSHDSDRVNILHASFPDYMLDPTRSRHFACKVELHHGKLADLCFRRIGENIPQFNICNLESSYQFDEDVAQIDQKVQRMIPMDLLYASQYWAVHLCLGGKSNERAMELHEFLAKRLLLWIEVLNLTKRIEKSIVLVEQAMSWLQEIAIEHSKSAIELAQDARRFTNMFSTSPISRSTPHLYVSMLASWPNHQPVARRYSQKAIDLVKIKGLEGAERQLGLLSLIPAGYGICCVTYSSNGQFFAAGTYDNEILIWDAVTCRMTIDPIKGHSGPVQAIVVSPDGTRICSGSHDKTLCIWDLQNGQLVAGPLIAHTGWVMSVNYSPNGQWLASGSFDGTVCIWSTHSWEMQGSPLEGHDGKVHSVVFSPNGSIIAVASGSVIQLWDPFSGQIIGEPFKGHTDLIRSLAFLPDGKHLVSGLSDFTVCIWDVRTGQVAFGPFHEHTYTVSTVTVSPDGHFMVSASADDTVRIWDTTTWQNRVLFRNAGTVKSVTFSPDGSRLVSGSVDGNVRIWEVRGFLGVHVSNNQLEGHNGWIRSVTFSPCGTYFISGSDDTTVCVWDLRSRRLMRNPLKHNHFVVKAGVSPDNNLIFSASEETIYIWNRLTGGLEYKIGPIKTDDQYDLQYQEIWPAAFLFDGKRVVCGSMSGKICMQDDNKPSFSLAGHNGHVYSIVFSPNGQSFASGYADGALMIWDATTGERLFDPLTGHTTRVNSIAFSPDGTQVASGSSDKTMRLWSSLTGAPIGNPFEGHTRGVRSVAFSPSGSRLVSGSHDGTLRVWAVATGQSIAVFEGHTDFVLSVAFSPDGTQIVSGSADMTIRLWKAPVQSASSSSRIDCDYPPERSMDNREGHTTVDWEMDADGWVRNAQDRLLLWVPPDLRNVLLRQQNTGLISRQGCIELDFSNARIGDNWKTCYKPFPPASEN
ncbi:vegetative incompatibility protein HET-E-1 [Rhizoctonia solani AG-3 Rhs1AP]|uniref:Vegetative incompatibility protein HET-E-1 n=1 Tax=Rhizoctonia solani AG-3 Rhs1AP TaxID=1086054 RepID=X8IYA8_9AGAM|nr:vegetative incompatibility protein HET-E-1 [Rhizoctonia solani AG-3 Rhs1AP]